MADNEQKMNEVAQEVNQETGEIMADQTEREIVVEETENYKTIKQSDGTFRRKAKYHDFTSFEPQTRDDKIWLLNLIDDNGAGQGLSENVGEQIEVQDIITRSYSSIDEKTGEVNDGVLTYLITPDRKAYVTSSKSVYFSVRNIMQLFGTPKDEDWQNIVVEVTSERTANGTAIKIKMVG